MSARAPGDLLLHPLALAALATWIVNDHVLKHACPSVLTGKLSDVASLAFFPLLPIAARELVLARRHAIVAPSHAWSISWIVATGLVMATINTIDLAADAYRWGLGVAQWPFRALFAGAMLDVVPVQKWMDPSDLWTLPALVVPLAIALRRGVIRSAQASDAAATAACPAPARP
ncbi:MAG: hypothetical protein J0L92_04305 [Deltaproteobacteria bacterium]|nr:hypothetical protein [Deltaproteobacteria bacterium]